jgi:dipeptidyl aminopeptidase/acylaminoacyl peptidase
VKPASEINMRTLPTAPWTIVAPLRLKLVAGGLAACFLAACFPARAAEPSRPKAADRYVPTSAELLAGYQRAQRSHQPPPQVYKSRITPHWFDNNIRFWYRNDLRGGTREFILVDAERGQRRAAFDHDKLAALLSKVTGKEYKKDRLPFDSIEYGPDGHSIRFQLDHTTWQVSLASYQCIEVAQPAKGEGPRAGDEPRKTTGARRRLRPEDSSVSPDGKWTAFLKDHNIYLRSGQGQETQLSRDGQPGLAYGAPAWAPDSKMLAAFRIEPGDHQKVYLLESSPEGGGRARFYRRAYDLPGDKLTTYELNLFQIDGPKHLKPDVERIDLDFPELRWNTDGRRVTFPKTDRGHQRFRLIEVDARSGKVRHLIDEKSKTFIWTAHTEMLRMSLINWLHKTDEIIYVSERDGWRHLYMVDAREGQIKHQITRGEWVVRGIDDIDEERRQVWFQASGQNADQDPYLIHYYRINFDGTHLVALTEGNGNHTVQFSPDRKFLIDTYSRVDMAPVSELRRVADGQRVCFLEEADTTELAAAGWQPPEVFVAKGRDGKTDIWGIIARPRTLDPAQKYPVIESIYAGPHGSFVPKSFSPFSRHAALTELGFIVVQIDGMGTANRGKAFHDVCWRNLKDAGFPDRIAWHKAVAQKYPHYDLDRVGIYGTSAGGQNAAGALLFHPEFYQAAVAACGCHDNRLDKASWNEQWMGYPLGPPYADSSNITHAANLRGKLLLIVGELDDNVPPESTYRFADALIKAGKDFEFLVVPGMRHSNGGSYGVRRMQDFFVRHLHGIEPPDWNALAAAPRRAIVSHANTPEPSRAGAATLPAVVPPPDSFFEKIPEKDRAVARTFYKKYINIHGLPVAASAEVDDQALERTYDLVTHMLAGRPDIQEALAKHGTRLIVISKDQVYTDMPEYRHHPDPAYQNERVRGTGGFDVTSFGEENLLNLPLDRYDDESIAVHEFCHTIDAALRHIDSTWQDRLLATYRSAMNKGLWKNTYASSNPPEYWAEICQSYYDCNRVNNWNHGAVGTREQLKLYDPEGYELVKTTFQLTPQTDWRYRPLRRQPSVTAPPAKFQIDPYYTKFTSAREFTVLGSSQVSDVALLKANEIIRHMFAYRHDILKAMIADGVRLVVLGRREKLSALPECRKAATRPAFDEVRYGDFMPSHKLLVVPEENVLGLPGDPFAGKCMVVSVFAKGLYFVVGLRPAVPHFDRRRDKQQYELRVPRLDVTWNHLLGNFTNRQPPSRSGKVPSQRGTGSSTGRRVSKPTSTLQATGLPPTLRTGRSTPGRSCELMTRIFMHWWMRRWLSASMSIGGTSRLPGCSRRTSNPSRSRWKDGTPHLGNSKHRHHAHPLTTISTGKSKWKCQCQPTRRPDTLTFHFTWFGAELFDSLASTGRCNRTRALNGKSLAICSSSSPTIPSGKRSRSCHKCPHCHPGRERFRWHAGKLEGS